MSDGLAVLLVHVDDGDHIDGGGGILGTYEDSLADNLVDLHSELLANHVRLLIRFLFDYLYFALPFNVGELELGLLGRSFYERL